MLEQFCLAACNHVIISPHELLESGHTFVTDDEIKMKKY